LFSNLDLDKSSLIYIAAVRGLTPAIELLIKLRIHPDETSAGDSTPLYVKRERNNES
jgi:hypothetical protein